MESRFTPLEGYIAPPPRLHYLEWNPAGWPAWMLLHGGTANGWWWQALAERIGAGPRLIALDQRGHGDSEWVVPPAYSPDDYAADIARATAALGLERPLLIGHSQGGINAIAYASRHPGAARAIVAIDSPVRSSPRRDRFLLRLRMLPTVVYPDLATAQARFRLMPDEGEIAPGVLAEVARRSLTPVAGGYSFKFDRESFHGRDGIDALAAIARIEVPILLVRAEHSRVLTVEAAQAALASNPLVRLVEMTAAHHHVLLEQPGRLAGLIADFAAELR